MADPFGDATGTKKKSEGVADVINRLLQNLVLKCSKEDGIRDYFHVAVIGYGDRVGPAFTGALSGRDLAPIGAIGNNPAKIEARAKKTDDGAGGILEQNIRFPIWLEATASGGTPMSQALRSAKDTAASWISSHPSGFPPVIINITDGEATDGDPRQDAAAIRQLESGDGRVLLFNIHISSQRAAPIEFPATPAGLPDRFAEQLFEMSSELPPHMVSVARQDGLPVGDGSRGFAFQADMVALIRFLDIGTRPSGLR